MNIFNIKEIQFRITTKCRETLLIPTIIVHRKYAGMLVGYKPTNFYECHQMQIRFLNFAFMIFLWLPKKKIMCAEKLKNGWMIPNMPNQHPKAMFLIPTIGFLKSSIEDHAQHVTQHTVLRFLFLNKEYIQIF